MLFISLCLLVYFILCGTSDKQKKSVFWNYVCFWLVWFRFKILSRRLKSFSGKEEAEGQLGFLFCIDIRFLQIQMTVQQQGFPFGHCCSDFNHPLWVDKGISIRSTLLL